MDEEDFIEELVNIAYQNLFAEDMPQGSWRDTPYSFHFIKPENFTMLAAPLQHKEIKMALFNMKPWKGPGPDGFPAGFLQNAWSIVGGDLCNLIQEWWDRPEEIMEANAKNIFLIPKVEQPEFVSQFRPISLCNVVYKVLTKNFGEPS